MSEKTNNKQLNPVQFNKMQNDLDKIFYEFESMNDHNPKKREIRCLFARIRKGIKEVNEYERQNI